MIKYFLYIFLSRRPGNSFWVSILFPLPNSRSLCSHTTLGHQPVWPGKNIPPFSHLTLFFEEYKWGEKTERKRAFSLVLPTDELGFFSGVLPAYLRAPPSVNPLRNTESQQHTARAVLQHIVKTSLNIRNSLLVDN